MIIYLPRSETICALPVAELPAAGTRLEEGVSGASGSECWLLYVRVVVPRKDFGRWSTTVTMAIGRIGGTGNERMALTLRIDLADIGIGGHRGCRWCENRPAANSAKCLRRAAGVVEEIRLEIKVSVEKCAT
jgi:hypothetical protein